MNVLVFSITSGVAIDSIQRPVVIKSFAMDGLEVFEKSETDDGMCLENFNIMMHLLNHA